MEEEWSALEGLKEDLENKATAQTNDEENFEITLSFAELLFTDPVDFRKNSNYEIRQSLFMVWFGGVLYYKKNQ